MPVPVENEVAVGRLPAAVEATAYFVVAEALTNIAKHARAGHAAVEARVEDGSLVLHVRDDGVGGARLDGSGIVGLRDRLAVLDGRLRVESPAEGGTLIDAAIPLGLTTSARAAGPRGRWRWRIDVVLHGLDCPRACRPAVGHQVESKVPGRMTGGISRTVGSVKE